MSKIHRYPRLRWFLPRALLAAAIYCGGYTALNAALSADLAAELSEIRARGEPAVVEELTLPEVAADRDAGPYFRGACALMAGLSDPAEAELGTFALESSPDAGPAWVDEEGKPKSVAEVDAWLRGQPALESLLDEVQRRPECKSDVSFETEGPYTFLPHLMPAKTLGRYALASSSAAARRGEGPRAARLQAASYRLAACAAADRYCMISALVAGSMETASFAHLQILLSTGALGAPELAEIEAGIAALPEQEQVYREAMIGERSGVGGFFFQAMLEGRSLGPVGELPAATGPVRLLLLGDFKTYLSRLGEEMRAPWKSQPESGENRALPRLAVFSGLLLPACKRFRERMKQVELRREISRCALALERERLAKGAYPDAIPARYSALGVRYERGAAGVTLRMPLPKGSREDEIVFRISR